MKKYSIVFWMSLLLSNASIAQSSVGLVAVKLGKVSFQLVHVDGGSFTRAGQKLELSGFRMMETEVTQALWKAVMGSKPSFFRDCPDCPVEQVNWEDVQAFIKKLNAKTGKSFRLPTEAEWEFAAGGGNKSKGYAYSGSDHAVDVAWIEDNSGTITHAVKTKRPNELGLYDMSGNVWEWCSDWYAENLGTDTLNPKGPDQGEFRVIRGGSWFYRSGRCAVSYRLFWDPALGYNDIGFRLVLPLPQ